MPDLEYDVAISGYGPTGLVCASLLARQGHRVCVFERWPSLYGQPRIATIDAESARILQAACDVDKALANATARERYLLCNGRGDILVDHDWGREDPSGFPHRISVHQPDIEDALDAAVRAAGAVVRQGHEVMGLKQVPGGVEITVRPTQAGNGEVATVAARYLIGADGARSTTRALLGIERESWPFRNAWLTVDVRRKRKLHDFLGVSPDGRIAAIFGVPDGKSHSVIPLGRDVLRFTFEIAPDVDRTAPELSELASTSLQEVYDLGEDDVEIIREAVHVFEGKLANRWRDRNVFLAGDAAHSMTPFMGQGGCSGLRDAANLSWKLDLVLKGLAPETILDTYEAERKPHTRVYVDGSDRLGAMIFTRDPAAAAERDRRYLEGGPQPYPDPPRIETGIVHGGEKESPAAPVGMVGPQGRVRWQGLEGRFEDIFGARFQILCLGRSPNEILREDQRAGLDELGAVTVGISAGARGGLVQDLDGTYARFLAQYGARGLILRPDFVVHSVAKSDEALAGHVDALLRQVTGRGKREK